MESPEQPHSYTRYEGEKWHPWPPVLHIKVSDLEKRALDNANFVMICGTRVHSLRFSLTVGFRRWDCINGFTS